MATLDDDLNELAITISMAIEKARQLNLSTSAYILSMALVEVWETTKGEQEGPTRDFTQ
jgi:tRNA(Leu) C34 or U34 (ribose-2'-O)-methylase TrmL